MKKINLNTPNSTYPFRNYCLTFDNAYVKHKNPVFNKGIGSGWVEAWHNQKYLNLDEKDYEKMGRHDLMYGKENFNKEYDINLNENIFLLYDPAGLNYAHFFFDFFGRLLRFEELSQIIPNLKLAIPEDYYLTEGNNTFIKQWIDLYFQNKNIEILVLKKDITYLISNLYIPNILYTFPEPHGDDYVIEKIIETVSKIPKIEVKSNGCYISRQDTLKRGWYHGRDLVNELELIEQIQNELGYDIIELMDYDIIGKIQIFKSYPVIVQQSSASNVNILFSNKENTHVIISNPRMADWLNFKVGQFSQKSKANLITLDGAGEYLNDYIEPGTDKGNYPWKLHNIEGIIDVLKQIDNGNI
jgi:capsular polysaccharide biosynthesis protein